MSEINLDILTNEIEQGFMQRGGWEMCRYSLGKFLDELQEENKQLKLKLKRIDCAYKFLHKNATFQGHQHWDRKGTHGTNCPLCLEIRQARDKADKIFNGEADE